MTETTRSISLNAYRAANPVHRCLTPNCSEIALVRCVRCGVTLCGRHAQVEGYCSDCSMALSNILARGGWVGSGVAVVGAVVSMYSSGLGMLALTVIFGGCFALLGVWTTAVGRALARNHFKRSNRFTADEVVLEGAEVEIAPNLPGPRGAVRRRRGVAGSGGHSAGATPRIPMYQRTYGAG